MPNLADRVPENRFIGLFVGRSGTGKTVAEASFPKPLKIEDFDGRVGGAQVPWLDQKGIKYDYWAPKEPGLIGKLNKMMEELLASARLNVPGMNMGIELPKTHVTDSITNQCLAFICQAIPLTHAEGKGRYVGITAMAGPTDYGLEAQAIYDYISFLKSLPISNIIISAHLVDRYGKPPGDKNEYAESVVIGKKLSIRDKIGENIQTSFDHIFEFERDEKRFWVKFWGEMARTSYAWLPEGRFEWTGKNFYEFMMGFKK